MVNKRPLCGENQENTDETEFATPQMLLTGYDLNTCPSYTLPKGIVNLIQTREEVIRYSRHTYAVYSRVWGIHTQQSRGLEFLLMKKSN